MKSVVRVLVTVLVLAFIGFIPIPYVIERTVPAMNANDFVHIDGGQAQKPGQIYLMAVSVSEARVFSAALALLPGYALEPEVDYIVPDDYYDRPEYKEERENSSITSSQVNALQVAYRAANRPVEVSHKSIYVTYVDQDSGFAKELQRGDVILKVDEQAYTSPYDIVDRMEEKKVGDLVTIEYSRNGVIGLASAQLIVDKTTGKPGLGIYFYAATTVLVNPPASFETHNVGGSSGGLMFSLEIYNQLVAEDITKGQIIAGTGTIDHKGNVGRIGGVASKVESAHQAGAKVFFVPDDSIDPEIAQLNPKLRSNYHEALRASIRLKSKMEIVPVQTFQDALNYLREMK